MVFLVVVLSYYVSGWFVMQQKLTDAERMKQFSKSLNGPDV